MITKAELLEILTDLDDNDIIVISNDSEGNGYRELECVKVGWKYCEGEIGLAELTDEDIEQGYGKDDVMCDPDALNAIILY